jgi:hypothetical protein
MAATGPAAPQYTGAQHPRVAAGGAGGSGTNFYFLLTMAGGGPFPTEPGFLDIPTFTLALMLAFFLICSLAFERVSGRLHACSTSLL